jgi:flagellar biosynthesis protein FlhG
VNQVRSAGEGRVVYERIAKVARQFLDVTVFDAGSIPTDDQVPTAVRRRTPFVLAAPRCPAAVAITQLAMRLQQGVAAAMPASDGFFARVGAWLKA